MALVAWLVTINILVLVFNLLPAYPMDGGRVARAIAWWRTGDRNSATRFAANLGRVFGYLFIGGGIAAGLHRRRLQRHLAGPDRDGDQRLRPRRGDADGADRPDRRGPRRRRDGPRAGHDPRRPQRRAGPRRVLPPLPLALVPGRRRRPPLPRPDPARPRRRGPGDLPRQLHTSPNTSTTTSASSSATTPPSTPCSPTRTCAASAR